MVRPLLRSLLALGSRPYFVAGLLTSLVLFGRGCGSEVTCEGDECAGAGGTDPGFSCNGVVCSTLYTDSPCVAEWECSDAGECRGVSYKPGFDDQDSCTADLCVEGEWEHEPVSEEDIDDGDPCTFDACTPALGITHTDITGCSES